MKCVLPLKESGTEVKGKRHEIHVNLDQDVPGCSNSGFLFSVEVETVQT